ncbi:hypothetical protein [Actinomadura sp. 9N407]|uniref:hypothetical protein n=1 Tax=Actinomadura sp. 9N407 TaxID=3375154 RepID=UPI0037BD1048
MDGKHKEPGPASEKKVGKAVRGLVPIAIASCAALAIGGAVDVVHQHQKSGKKERSATAAAKNDETGPRFVVGVRTKGTALVVRDVRTGHDVGLPVAAPQGQRFQRVAAAGERSYIVATGAGKQVTFQRLELKKDGSPEALEALPEATVTGVSTAWSDLAVGPKGEQIAYVTYQRGGGSKVDVVSAKGGGHKAWTSAIPARVGNLSWAGTTLSFVYTPVKKAAGKTVHQVRTLDTNAAAGDLKVSEPVLKLPAGSTTAVLSRDGASVLSAVFQNGQVTMQAYAAATGRPAKVLWTRKAPGTPSRLDLDHSGEHLLAAGSDGPLFGSGPQSVPGEDLLDAAW